MEQPPANGWSPPEGLRPARLSVGIISAGRVGTALGYALERVEHVVVACSAISGESRLRAARRLPETTILPVPDVAQRAELLLLTVPDAELPSLVSGLAATGVVRPGTIVVHTSGANGVAVLAPLTEVGCIPLAIHPAMTFTGSDEDITRLPDACFGVTAADEVGYAIGQSLVLEIGGEPFRVPEHARTQYHAALAHASNHLVTLVLDAVDTLRASLRGQELLGQELVGDAPGGLPERVVGPLARAALENALQRGQAALTGPVARGDAAAVAAHLNSLQALDSQLAQAYRADSLRTAQRAHAPMEVFAVLSDTGPETSPETSQG
ncbi:oxidoreductase [Mycolicibacterium sp. (ex Dasyatis americana)]|nr:oxidoreductase [Mycolicibacterium sp. (ex Dasyatis americana)]